MATDALLTADPFTASPTSAGLLAMGLWALYS